VGSIKAGISLAALGSVRFSRRDYLDQERSSEHGNESLGSIKGGNIFGLVRGYWIPQKKSAS
jgi:hypothetical protein